MPSFRPEAYKRPRHFLETPSIQKVRTAGELEEARQIHTLSVIRKVANWFEVQRELGSDPEEADFLIEAASQCRRNGMFPSHIPVAVETIRDIYARILVL